MGKLFDQFHKYIFSNEAEVSQNFILPLLQNYLGYKLSEIIPEKHFPARKLYSGVNFAQGGSKGLMNRPDFVICIDGDPAHARFIIDSKAPKEILDEHLGQLQSYANSVGRNFLMITNGCELKVYDVNNLIFYSENLEDLQIKLEELIKLLGKKNQLLKSPIEIIQEIDLEKSVSKSDQNKIDQAVQKRRILLSDFQPYLSNVINSFKNWHLPTEHFHGINNLDIKKFDPNHLLSFKEAPLSGIRSIDDKILKLSQISSEPNIRTRILIGDTGTGKTSLLKFLTLQAAERAQNFIDTKIPIYIPLKEVGYGYNLEELIISFLKRNGYQNYNSVPEFPTDRFVFFLDAFDEAAEMFRKGICHAIEKLALSHECYITTRPNVHPKIQLSAVYHILPLTDKQVEDLSRSYMGPNYYNFQRQIENNGLVNESRNTLLLLFLISLFKDDLRLPESASKIIKAMVDRVSLWHEGRYAKNSSLTWKAISFCLSKIAFRICEEDEVTMNVTAAESLVREMIIELEDLRQIPNGTTIQTVFDALAETGLLIVNNDHFYFWHRLFLNHFAALYLKDQYLNDHNIIERLSVEERWEIVIISVCSNLPDITPVIKCLKKRLWLASYCLLENSNCAEVNKNTIISTLGQKLKSPIPEVRKKAMFYLEGIDNAQTQNILLDIFSQNHTKDVKMMALSAIGKIGTKKAKDIIYQHVDWDDSDFFLWRSSQAYIVDGLSHFGEEGHLQIIENWKKHGHWVLQETCKKIFFRLHATGNLTPLIISSLHQFYIEEFLAKDQHREKISAIAEVLALSPNTEFEEKVLGMASQNEVMFPKLESLETIIKNSPDISLASKVKDVIIEKKSDRYLVEHLAKALKNSVAFLPKDFYISLISHENIYVASIALESLERFPFNEIKSEVERHLYNDQPQLQCRALSLLIKKGKFIDLIREDRFPNPFFTPTAHTLLEGVRKFQLMEAMPLLYRIQDALYEKQRYREETALAYELAGTFYYLGEKIRHAEIIKWYFYENNFLLLDEYSHSNLLKKVKFFDPSLAESIAGCFYRTYVNTEKGDRLEADTFIEVAEEIGGDFMRTKVKEIAINLLPDINNPESMAKHNLERPFRALVKLGKPSDEDWVLGLLPQLDYDAGFESPQLRRALEYLAYYGSTKALQPIISLGQKHKSSEGLINICQFAYNSICSREKVPISERDLFEISLAQLS